MNALILNPQTQDTIGAQADIGRKRPWVNEVEVEESQCEQL